MVAEHESKELAARLVQESCLKQGIQPGQLPLHADRGAVMQSLAQLLAELGVSKTHSRPHVSNDNPFSESHFKTLKYRPGVPDRFGSLQHARGVFRELFDWYNHHHRHSGIGLLTPAMVHYGVAEQVRAARQDVLTAAYLTRPDRFVGGVPQPPVLPPAVWINPPELKTTPQDALQRVAEDRVMVLYGSNDRIFERHPPAPASLRAAASGCRKECSQLLLVFPLPPAPAGSEPTRGSFERTAAAPSTLISVTSVSQNH